MRRNKPISNLGWAIRKRLADLKIDQKEFCRQHNIPEYRLSRLINGGKVGEKNRQEVMELLCIDESSIEEG